MIGMKSSGDESYGVMKQCFLWSGTEVVMCTDAVTVTHWTLATQGRQKNSLTVLWFGVFLVTMVRGT